MHITDIFQCKFQKQLVITTDDGFIENYSIVCPILETYKVKGNFFLIENCVDNVQMMWRHVLFILQKKIENSVLIEAMKSLAQEFNLGFALDNEGILKWSRRSFPYKFQYKLTCELWKRLTPFSLKEYLNLNPPYLKTEHINEMLRSGHIIGSHSKSHPFCELLNIEELKFEIKNSMINLGKKFSTEVIAFSFPFGRNSR